MWADALPWLSSSRLAQPRHPQARSGVLEDRRTLGLHRGAFWQDEITEARHGRASTLLRDAMRHVAAGRFGDAEELCRLVLTRSPNHPEAWMVLGKGLIGERRWSEAEVVLAHGCSLSPGLAELHAALGQLYLELHRFGDAMGPIENCVLLDPAAGKERATLVAIYGTLAFATFSERSKVAMTVCLADRQ